MKASSFCARALPLFLFLSLFAISAAAQQDNLTKDLHRSFRTFEINRSKPALSENERRTLSVRFAGKDYRLDVEPNDLRSKNYRAENTNMIGMAALPAPEITTYKGRIAGDNRSEVRLTMDGETLEGFFEDASGRMFIEPARKYSPHARAGESIIYRAEDSVVDSPFICGTDLPTKIQLGDKMTAAGRVDNSTVFRVLELATDADLEYVQALGGPNTANSEILSILNMVEGTYNNELNLSIRVVYQHTWSVADPYGIGEMPAVLTAFVNHWNANFGGVARDAAHLFTAKEATVGRGMAYIGVVCRTPSFSYGLSGYVNWAPGKFLVSAHEIGHNLNADHVDEPQGCANTLMNAFLTNNTPLSFCNFSRDAISNYVAANNSCLSESSQPSGTAVFDFDGDSRSDISVFRPSDGVWYLNRSTSGFTAFQFGLSIDKPVAADYDGDNRADAAVFRSGVWYRMLSGNGTTDVRSFGLPGDIPVPADFDGDSKMDIAVFRPSTGVWYWIRSSTGEFGAVRFGLEGDIPLPGDYDGDGRADINVFRPSNGIWYRLDSSTGAFYAQQFGMNGDKPVAGDFDGDAKSDIAVWRPSTGVWWIIRSSNGGYFAQTFGLSSDIPTTADFDGDGKTDLSVFRPSSGVWYRLNSGNGSFAAIQFGLSGDAPIPSYYIQ